MAEHVVHLLAAPLVSLRRKGVGARAREVEPRTAYAYARIRSISNAERNGNGISVLPSTCSAARSLPVRCWVLTDRTLSPRDPRIYTSLIRFVRRSLADSSFRLPFLQYVRRYTRDSVGWYGSA